MSCPRSRPRSARTARAGRSASCPRWRASSRAACWWPSPDDRLDALVADLTALNAPGLQIDLERTDEPVEQESLQLQLELLGADRPGIVAQISASLAAHGVNIDELTTDVRDAPMAGGTLFEARAVLSAPPETSTDALRSLLEELGDEMMVEIRVSEG